MFTTLFAEVAHFELFSMVYGSLNQLGDFRPK